MGGDVAQHARKILLDVPPQVPDQEKHFAGELGITFGVHGSGQVIFAPDQRRHDLGAEGQDERCSDLPPGRRQAPGLRDREAHRGKQRKTQLDDRSRKYTQPLARPRLGIEQVVQGERDRRLQHHRGKNKGHRKVAFDGLAVGFSASAGCLQAASRSSRRAVLPGSRSPRSSQEPKLGAHGSSPRTARSPSAGCLR